MKEDKDPKNNVSWCLQQKRGVKLEDPNDNLCRVYLKKAKSALNMLNAALEREEIDWIATTAYYSRYFALYALLQKCGIKSEIHDCTISLLHFLFVEENLIGASLYQELLLSKDLRVETQYYVTEQIDQEKLKMDSAMARNFVLQIEEEIADITPAQIVKIRQKLTNVSLHR